MPVRLTAQGVEYERGLFGNPLIVKQFSTARIKVLGTFTINPSPNTIYNDYNTGIPATAQARKHLRLGFARQFGGLTGTNNAAINNTVYWGFQLGYNDYGHKLEYEYFTDGTGTRYQTFSNILVNFRYRSENVTSVASNYLVRLYTYG